MGVAASGRLAAAVAAAGGLGLIGVGYRGQDWIESQTDAAGNVRVGAGFITWRLQMSPELLDVALPGGHPRSAFRLGIPSHSLRRSTRRMSR
jgi:nitronate monooxygenase